MANVINFAISKKKYAPGKKRNAVIRKGQDR